MDPNRARRDRCWRRPRRRPPAARLPESTYRLQFHAGFTFRDATAIVPYLRDLGITHCYASPYLKARPGSTHGYDIIDHGCAQPGDRHRRRTTRPGSPPCTSTAWARSSTPCPTTWASAPTRTPGGTTCWRTARPRATAPTSTSPGGPRPGPELQDKVLLPVLGDPYGDVLEAGQLRLAFADGAFFDPLLRPPLSRRPAQLRQDPRRTGSTSWRRALGAEDPALIEYQSILTAVRNLPGRTETDPDKVAERQREKEVIKRRLAALAAESEPVRAFIEQNVAAVQRPAGRPAQLRPAGRPAGAPVLPPVLLAGGPRRDQLPPVLRHQRPGRPEHGARRRSSRPRTRLVLRLLAEGKVDGLRIDHPDGLYDPAQYFRRLQEHHVLALARRAFEADARARRAWTGTRWKAPSAIASPPAMDEPGEPAGPAALRRRREDPRGRRGRWSRPGRCTAPAATTSSTRSTACSSTPSQRASLHPAVPRLGPGRHALRRAGLPQEAADPAGVALQRAAHADPPARPAGAEEPAVAGLHLQHPAPRPAGGDRLLPRLSLVHRRRGRPRRRPPLHRDRRPPGHGPQPAAEPAACSASSATCCCWSRPSRSPRRTGPSSGGSPASSSR